MECELNNGFDGLIGNNILKDIGCILDYQNRLIITHKSTLPIYLNKEEENYHIMSYKENVIEVGNNDVVKENLLSFVKTDHLNGLEVMKLKPILLKYKQVFYNSDQKLSFTSEIKHKVNTKHDMPIYSKLYRYPEVHKEEVNRQIQEMLKDGIIRESTSPYNSPIWIVPKKQDFSNIQKWRIVIDYRKLNDITIEDRFPIPNIEDIFDKLGNSQYFSTIDLAKGFHQIEMDPSHIHKTAFSTANGHYEFLRMPFGLRNAPATFQRLINNVLKDYIGKICLVYLDDILVFSTSIEEHMESLNKVFKCLQNANLRIQPDKCLFLSRETEFLGHIITPEGIRTNPKKVEAVDKILLPRNQKEIKSFLGITGYYRRFIKDYSKVAYPLIKYLKKGARINLKDVDYRNAFEKLKLLIKSDPILVHPDFKKIFTLVTDASNFALGAALMQNDRIISYASRSLNGHEKNYSTIEKELLAIVWATKHFRPYLFGRRFIIRTDHRPLVWLSNLKEPNSKLQRWKIKLNEFDFDINYIKGKENVIADGLSRVVQHEDDNVIINLNELFEEDIETVHSAETDSTDFIKITENALNVFKNQLILKNAGKQSSSKKILFKKKIRETWFLTPDSDILELMREKLPERGLLVVFCPDNKLFLQFQELYIKYFVKNKNLKILRTCILLEDITDEGKSLQIIETEHLGNNHRGINETFAEIKKKFYYPTLQKVIQKYINNCEICNKAKYDRNPIKHSLNITHTPHKHNEIIHVDIWYPQRNIMYLTTIDKFTKYATAHQLNDRTWVSIVNAIKLRIQYLGKPEILVTDNELDVAAVKQFLKDYGVQVIFTTTYNKTGNSDVERLHLTLNEHIRLFNADSNNFDNLQEQVTKAIIAYNNTIHSTTKLKPIDFINNSISRDDLKEMSDKLNEKKRDRINAINMKQNNINHSNFENNYVKNYRVGKSQPKYKKISNYRVEGNHLVSNDNKFKKIYKTQVKRKYTFQDNSR